MNIVVVGTGYVGLVTGICLAEMGNTVTCIDINTEKIEGLKQGIIPIYEPELDSLLKKNIDALRVNFSTSLKDVISDADIVFSAVGTPPQEDGSADLKYVLEVAKEFGNLINRRTIFVTKSTVPVGTSKKVKDTILNALAKRGKNVDFDVVSNPEFLKEGSAVKDFLYPERIVVGTDTEYAESVMKNLYSSLVGKDTNRLIFTDIESAEMIKYASNAMLATRISFMNEIANLCNKVGANIESVRKGIGTDSRIGSKFLKAGCGYGGSCFPKDVRALIQTGAENGEEMTVLRSVDKVNEKQKHLLLEKIKKHISINCSTIGILGIAFKPETDDVRESPSIILIRQILAEGGKIRVYDPIAMDNCKRLLQNSNIEYCENIYDVSNNVDALVLVTEWKEFMKPNWNSIYQIMKNKVIIDGRNVYSRKELEDIGFIYESFGN